MVINAAAAGPMQPAEQELLALARTGDAAAFCKLLEPLQGRLLRQATALTNDLHAAEDLVSETRIRSWRSLTRYNETCRLSTWLYAILLHCHQEACRRTRARPIALCRLPANLAKDLQHRHENSPSFLPSPSMVVTQTEVVRELSRCVDMLPEKHREVVQLRFFEDASLHDMAAVLGCSVGTVKSRLHHALNKLRKMKLNLPRLERHQQL